MKISGSGIARTGLLAVAKRRELYHAKAAISCLHDALLAVAKGMITPDQVREFFWWRDLANAEFYGDVLNFKEEGAESAIRGPDPRPWREILWIRPDVTVTREMIHQRRIDLARIHHSDIDGDNERMAEINAAADRALQEIGA